MPTHVPRDATRKDTRPPLSFAVTRTAPGTSRRGGPAGSRAAPRPSTRRPPRPGRRRPARRPPRAPPRSGAGSRPRRAIPYRPRRNAPIIPRGMPPIIAASPAPLNVLRAAPIVAPRRPPPTPRTRAALMKTRRLGGGISGSIILTVVVPVDVALIPAGPVVEPVGVVRDQLEVRVSSSPDLDVGERELDLVTPDTARADQAVFHAQAPHRGRAGRSRSWWPACGRRGRPPLPRNRR